MAPLLAPAPRCVPLASPGHRRGNGAARRASFPPPASTRAGPSSRFLGRVWAQGLVGGAALGRRRAPAPLAATIITEAELDTAASERGVLMGISTLGPFWRVTARQKGAEEGAEGAGGEEDEAIVGVAEGFCALGILHIDSMRIFNSRLKSGQKGVWGLTILVGVAAGLHGLSKGCTKAEILAINDSDKQHARLVKFYSRIGWEPVREVEGGRLQDIPDMLVWGGAGTRMNGDVTALVAKWSGSLKSKPQSGGS